MYLEMAGYNRELVQMLSGCSSLAQHLCGTCLQEMLEIPQFPLNPGQRRQVNESQIFLKIFHKSGG